MNKIKRTIVVFAAATVALLSSGAPAMAETPYPTQGHKEPTYCGYGNRDACKSYNRYDALHGRLMSSNQDIRVAAMYTLLLPVERSMQSASGLDSAKVVRAYQRGTKSCRNKVHQQLVWLNYDLYKTDKDAYLNKQWFGLILDTANPYKVAGVGKAAGGLVAKSKGANAGRATEQQVNSITSIANPYKPVLEGAIQVGQGLKYRNLMHDRILYPVRTTCQI